MRFAPLPNTRTYLCMENTPSDVYSCIPIFVQKCGCNDEKGYAGYNSQHGSWSRDETAERIGCVGEEATKYDAGEKLMVRQAISTFQHRLNLIRPE